MPSPIRRYAEKYLPAGAVNFWCHVIEGTFASFGEGIVAGAVVFPILAASLGATPVIFWWEDGFRQRCPPGREPSALWP